MPSFICTISAAMAARRSLRAAIAYRLPFSFIRQVRRGPLKFLWRLRHNTGPLRIQVRRPPFVLTGRNTLICLKGQPSARNKRGPPQNQSGHLTLKRDGRGQHQVKSGHWRCQYWFPSLDRRTERTTTTTKTKRKRPQPGGRAGAVVARTLCACIKCIRV
jgi:hypothetical protein